MALYLLQDLSAKMLRQKLEKQKLGKIKTRNYQMQKQICSLCKNIASLCEKAGKKLSDLVRLPNFMCANKKKVLMKAFIQSPFGYCLDVSQQGCQQKKLTTYMSDHDELFIKTILLVLSKIFLNGITRLLFIRGTSNHQLQNYLRLMEIFQKI